MILADGPTLVIDATLLASPMWSQGSSLVSPAPAQGSLPPTLAEVERRYIVETLEKTH
jgi:hypothetical protein